MISCNEYDYIEIVCLYHYPITITLQTGVRINGTALDTKRNARREECIKVLVKGSEILVRLDDITKLQVSIENPHFSEITFQQNDA